ncbi:hypothetical protein Dtox_0142 [Desulfofarcimen acetoxidans DSM 771]|uniref:Uncharacterized protein n=1 Tax=Desulfofarcimen acetoxidans (strain ATCC 49208 / DSM 771 / KCTC 5769 / VKM B-1644 / 5575) TaxID=485916 RepID=C8W2U6_DESAS|nr:hypothetical protein [Desulfofarcimen acetoxidans]ACV61102.1 hypothetical protein Dtox_0142 [Desulfofarcimen acetoxidans DSM 771]
MFYELEKDDKYPSVWYSDSDDFDPFISIKCPKYPGHQRGVRDINVNLWIDIKKPKMGDFVSTVYSDWLITDHVAEIFKANNLTGYRLQPVKVCNKKLDFNLWELIITGSAGKAHPDSGIYVKEHCEYCGSMIYSPIKKGIGIIVDEARWDGSDFFTITEYYKYVFITEKVKKIIEENNLRGVRLVWPSELGFDES